MAKQQNAAPRTQDLYTRFTVSQRIEHIILLISFATLGLTGLSQKFVGNALAEGIIALLGGIETVRIIHRVAAIVFALQSVYHVVTLFYKIYVKRVELTMLPGLRDVTDAIDVIRYNLGLTKQHPKLPRYNFVEKAEYWALIWGGIIMGLTGFMLWNPIATARFFPGQVIPAAKAAHGAEAILAVLAIFVWHFYSVHIKMFNKSMFTGTLTRQQMEEEHGEELEQILSGRTRPPADPAGIRRRERIFLPITIGSGLLLGTLVLWFATFEQTAITTLPEPVAVVTAFVPLTPTPISIVTVDNRSLGAAVPHPVEGDPYSNCLTCHKLDGIRPFPQNHDGRPVESCVICHQPGPAAPAGSETSATGPARPIPHPIEGDAYKDCTTCHGEGKMKPFPANHTGFATDSCTLCHKPAATEQAPSIGAAKPIPHPIEGEIYKDCTFCHGEGKIRPFPANHTTFANENCTTCHKPAQP